MEIFPAGFPTPQTQFNTEAAPSSVRTQMDSGTVRQRPRFTTELLTVNIQWELSDLERGVFVAWHKFKINRGNDWFEMNLPLSGEEFAVHVVRFQEGTFKENYVDVGYWDVSATLDIQARVTMTEDSLAFYLANGFSNSSVSNLLFDVNAFDVFLKQTYPTYFD